MNTDMQTTEMLLRELVGAKAAKQYSGRLAPLVLGEGDLSPHPKLAAAMELARRLLEEELKRGDALLSSRDAHRFLRAQFLGQLHESFIVLYLDNRHRVIEVEELFKGTIDGAMVYPREVVRSALKWNAAACILAHNHPSGVAEPSNADIHLTKRIKEALALVDIRTLDHVIVGARETVSMAEKGML